jgi:uncharacterized protein (DUF885 family)
MSDSHTKILASLAEDFLRDYFLFYPTSASILGLHSYDGQIPDLSQHSITNRLAVLQDYHARLQQIDTRMLDRLDTFDYDLLRWRIDAEIWAWSEYRDHTRNPMLYADLAMVDGYIKRNYAPLEVRTEALIHHLNEIPAAMEGARENLADGVPRVLIEESLPVFEGLITFLQDSLNGPFKQSNISATLLQSLWQARDKAVDALKGMGHFLNTLLPTAPEEFAIGPTLFSNMLAYNELIDMPLESLLRLGEEDLHKNQAAITEVAAQIDPTQSVAQLMQKLGQDHPPAERLVEETRQLLDSLRNFLVEQQLVTLPQDAQCLVQETPPFARWAFAMMDTAGPFERVATEAFYYVTLPEPDWSPEKIEGWLTKFDYATMTGVSIHEAYPGHFVHFMQVPHAPTKLAKTFDTYSHYESWAHYCEEMMLEQGYGNGNLQLRLAQLGEALVRNCRYICAIKMHTQGMGVEEATRFFMDNAYMDEVTATKEARRGTHDPGYINYTLGKLLLRQLRDDYRAFHGANFSLKRFHDEYIGYGSPPIPILRKMML